MGIRKPLVLVAEESKPGRWALVHVMQAQGFEVYAASTWIETMGWLERAPFDVTVVSSSLERDRLTDVLASLRRRHPAIGLILLADQDDVRSVRQICGADAIVIAKHLDPERVVEAIRALVATEFGQLTA